MTLTDSPRRRRALALAEGDPLSARSMQRDRDRLAELVDLRRQAGRVGYASARDRLERRGYSADAIARRVNRDPGIDVLAEVSRATRIELPVVVASLLSDPYLCRRALVVAALRDCRTAMHRDLAEAFGCSVSTVGRAAEAAGLSRGQRHWSEEIARRDQRIRQRYAEGLTSEELCRIYALSRSRMSEILSGADSPPGTQDPGAPPGWSDLPPIPTSWTPPRRRFGGRSIEPTEADLRRLREIRDEWVATGEQYGKRRRRAILRAVTECPSVSYALIGYFLGVGRSVVATTAHRHGAVRRQRPDFDALREVAEGHPLSARSLQEEGQRLATLSGLLERAMALPRADVRAALREANQTPARVLAKAKADPAIDACSLAEEIGVAPEVVVAALAKDEPLCRRAIVRSALRACPGLGYRAIGPALGVSAPTVSRIAAAAGIARGGAAYRAARAQRLAEAVLGSLAEGASAPEVARLYGISVSRVRDFVADSRRSDGPD